MDGESLVLGAVSTSTRVFGACLCASIACSQIVRHYRRAERHLPPALDFILTILAYAFALAAFVALFWGLSD